MAEHSSASRSSRTVPVTGSGSPELLFISNRISTGRYILVSFLPTNLFEQFQRIPNLWFLLISIFQLAADHLSPTTGWSTMAPLLLLLFISMIKDAFIDYKRHKQDREINNKQFLVWNGNSFIPTKCEDIKVGHLVLLRTGEFAPADLLLLATGHSKEICYVDISGLLGETNLKVKSAIKATKGLRSTDLAVTTAYLHRLQGEVHFQDPDLSLDSFDGRIKLKGFPTAERVSLVNLILRGSVICSTPWVICLVLYTGKETKIMLNAHKVPLKNTRVERLINKVSLVLLLLCVILALTSTFLDRYATETETEYNFFVMFIIFILLYQNITPISLFVTLDILRIYTLWVMRRKGRTDPSEYDILNTGVCEDLGRVEYIIADKTGTLTENWGAAKEFVLGEESFSPCDKLHNGCRHMDKSITNEGDTHSDEQNGHIQNGGMTCGYSLLRHMLNPATCPKNADLMMEALAVCNSMLLSEGGYEMVFAREDKALVSSANDFGYTLVEKTSEICRINVRGTVRNYRILGLHESTGVSPRFRIIIQRDDCESGFLFIKGPPQVMVLGRKSIIKLQTSTEFVVSRKEEELIRSGLKSIIIGFREISGDDLIDLKAKLELANKAIYNKDDKTEKLFDLWEVGCEYLGMVGVEEGVLASTGEAVQKLMDAGIKIWVTSGDDPAPTQIAAINAKILNPEHTCITIRQYKNSASISFLRKKLTMQVKRLIMNQQAGGRDDYEDEMMVKNPMWGSAGADFRTTAFLSRSTFNMGMDEPLKKIPYVPEDVRKFALIVHGGAFSLAMKDQECKRLLSCLMFLSTTVLFCNMLPLQKAQVVKLIKENFKFRPVTMAIGDGNDDIAMIQEADIGVGMKKEGESRATNNADVAIGYFSQLQTLLLVDGRWYLQRYSKVAMLFLYKNILLVMILFGYVFFCDYQPTSILDSGLLTLYNIFFTSIPVLCIGLFDEDISESVIMRIPDLYRMRTTIFGWRWVLVFFLIALAQCLSIFFGIIPAFHHAVAPQGFTNYFDLLGVVIFIALVLTVLAQESMDTAGITILYVGSVLLSMTLLVIYLIVTSYYPWSDLFNVLPILFSNPITVLRFLIPAIGTAGIGYAFRTYQRMFNPMPNDELRRTGVITMGKRHNRIEDYTDNLKKMYRASTSAVEIEEKDAFMMSPYTLRFRSEYVERSYRWSYIQNHLGGLRIFYVIISVLLVAWLVYGVATGSDPQFIVIVSGIVLTMLVLIYLTRWNVFQRRYVPFVLIAILVSLLAKFLTEMLFIYDGSLLTAIYPLATYTMLNVDFLLVGVLNFLNIFLFAISGSVYYAVESGLTGIDGVLFMLSYMVILIGITIMAGHLGYHLIYGDRQEFKLFQQTCAEVQRCREILSCLLPEFVRSRVREGARYIAEEKGIVTILFCDIYDFDNIIGKMKPNEITEFLDDLFQKFDELCTLNGVTKIETVGKTYMACAGLKDSEGDMSALLRDICHARRAIELALSMLRTLENYYLPDGTKIKVKIGINSGPVVAGVVGYHKPQFSLVGDTVNTASRMCSTIDTVNTIQISEAVHKMLEDRRGIQFEPHFLSNVKGKGSMNTFLVSEIVDINIIALESIVESQDDLLAPSLISTQTTLNRSVRSHPSHTDSDAQARIFGENNDPDKVEPVTFFSCCKLKESPLQMKFRMEYLVSNLPLMTWGLYIAAVVRSLVMCLRIAEMYYDPPSTPKECVIGYGMLTVTTLISALFVRKFLFARMFPYVLQVMYATNIVFILFDVIFDSKYEIYLMAMEAIYCQLQLAHCSGYFFGEVVLGCATLVVEWIIATPWSHDPVRHGGCLVFIICFMLINLHAQYSHETRIRLYANMTRYAKKEIENTEQLLSHMMPQHVLSKLKEDSDTTDTLPNVTILFADIVGFTNWSSDKLPVEVVEMLSDMFTRFDKLSVSNHVYKVHTIGDCYVVMGFAAPELSLRNFGQECLNTVKMAFDMIDVINEVNEENGSQLNMRIGLHTGTVIGGITGTNIVRYDIYGPDVMFANKMESNGQAGKVNVSDTTRLLMEDTAPGEFYYTFNKDIEAKSLGITHKCFLVSELFPRRSALNPALNPISPSASSVPASPVSAFPPPQPNSQSPRSQDTFDNLESIELDNVHDRQSPREMIAFPSKH